MEKGQFKEKKIQYDMNYHADKFGEMLKDKNKYLSRGRFVSGEIFKYDFDKESKVLEFGCGIGQNLVIIKNAYGFDIDKELYPFLKERGIKTFNSLKEIPNKFFDEILLSMVLEHLPNPIETLTFLRKKLKKNGKIRIVVPGLTYYIREDINKSIDGHIFGWSFYEMNYLLNYCGFQNLLDKKLYRKGYERFAPFYKISFGLYSFLVKSFGRMFNQFDILVVAKLGDVK